jgi:hypothetical protein
MVKATVPGRSVRVATTPAKALRRRSSRSGEERRGEERRGEERRGEERRGIHATHQSLIPR